MPKQRRVAFGGARIEELIGDGARLEREESADADGARGWAPVQADDDAWPGGACRYDISCDVVAVLRECKPGSAVEYFDEDDYLLFRFEREERGVREMFCEPMGYWDIGSEGAGEVSGGGNEPPSSIAHFDSYPSGGKR